MAAFAVSAKAETAQRTSAAARMRAPVVYFRANRTG